MRFFSDQYGNSHDFGEAKPAMIAAIAKRDRLRLTALTEAEFHALINPPLTLDQVKAAKLRELERACSKAITGGVVSSALGAPHTYPTNLTDQQNLAANVLASLLPGLPEDWTTDQICCDQSGKWAYLPHTASQIQQVSDEVKSAILALRVYYKACRDAVASASDITTVEQITFNTNS